MERVWLKEQRMMLKKTQQDVATECRISRQFYSFIENGDRGVPVHTAKKIAAVLGFDWQKFFEDEVEQKENPA